MSDIHQTGAIYFNWLSLLDTNVVVIFVLMLCVAAFTLVSSLFMIILDNKLASRAVNEGFSGGEKKRNEIFQMAMLEPKLSILDETDSGLDIDAYRG